MQILFRHDLPHAVQNICRAVGIVIYVGTARAAGEDEDGGKAGFHARNDVVSIRSPTMAASSE